MRFLLDTNVLSEFKKPRPDEQVVAWSRAADEDNTFISVVTIGELRRGVALLAKGRRRSEFDEWVREELPRRFEGRILDVTAAVAEEWGELMAGSKLRGLVLEPIDAYIAATARLHALTLVTRNVKDFKNLEIDIINPWLTR